MSENKKKDYPKSVSEVLRIEEIKICARGLLLHKKNSSTYYKQKNKNVRKEEVNVRNINSIH
jgi:hypothetical protein